MKRSDDEELRVVYPSIWKSILNWFLSMVMMIFGLIGVFVGLAAIFGGQLAGYLIVAQILSVILVVVGLLVFLANLILRTPRLELHRDGFRFVRVFNTVSREWGDIKGEFETVSLGFMRASAYSLTPEYVSRTNFKSWGAFPGYDDGVSGWFVVSAKEVTSLLNEYKQRFDQDSPRL